MTKKTRSVENPSGNLASLADLQESVQDRSAFTKLADYVVLTSEFLAFLKKNRPTRIVSPTVANYVFYQYGEDYAHRITRPLNTNLLIESATEFKAAFDRFMDFLADLKRYELAAIQHKGRRQYVESKEIDKVVYTVQQSIGSIGDSFENPNQCRKRVGDLFETLVSYLLNKLLGRDIPVIAIFLHDVQRAVKGDSIFGVNSTFKSNHFLAYTVAMKRLNGVYYVDPRPKMIVHERLREQIRDFQQFLVNDLWELSSNKGNPHSQ
ncbi:MAG: hypothetical protein HY646_20690 [Acidobacteria bacterium]|nr:hypothetical protein [Acidobacteriota bacterium]